MLNNAKTVLIDCDGVLWRGKEAIEGASEFLVYLKKSNKKVRSWTIFILSLRLQMIFVTNSSVSTRAQHAEKIKSRLQLDFSIEEDSVFTAAAVTADFLSSKLPRGASVYVMGLEGIQKELEGKGFAVSVAPAPVFDDISAVVVGFDPSFSYAHIAAAMKIFALNPGCLLVGCNLDSSYVNESGFLAPGTGTLVIAVAYATEKQPIIMGKPNNLLYDTLLLRW